MNDLRAATASIAEFAPSRDHVRADAGRGSRRSRGTAAARTGLRGGSAGDFVAAFDDRARRARWAPSRSRPACSAGSARPRSRTPPRTRAPRRPRRRARRGRGSGWRRDRDSPSTSHAPDPRSARRVFGSGVLPGGGPPTPARVLDRRRRVHDTGRTGIERGRRRLAGQGRHGAIVKTEEAQRRRSRSSDRGKRHGCRRRRGLRDRPGRNAELQEILQSFTALAVAAVTRPRHPPGQAMLIAAALERPRTGHRGGREGAGRCGRRAAREDGRARHRPKTSPIRVRRHRTREHDRRRARRPRPRPPSHPRLRRGEPCGVRVREFLGFVADAGPTKHLAGHALVGRMRGGRIRSRQIGRSRSGAVHLDTARGGEGVEVVLPDGSTAVAPTRQGGGGRRPQRAVAAGRPVRLGRDDRPARASTAAG